MKKFVFSALLLTFSLSSFAQANRGLVLPLTKLPRIATAELFFRPQPKSQFAVAAAWTDDSTFVISGSIDPKVKWIWLRITKEDQIVNSFMSVEPGPFTRKDYLRVGPGNYKIEVYQSINAGQYQGSYTQAAKFEVVNTDTRENMDALFPTSDIQSDSEEIVSLAQTITEGLTTDMEKTRAIHDYIADNIAYDAKILRNDIYKTMAHDALTILSKKMAICDGYANLTAALNRAVGIPTKKVYGEAIREGSAFTGNSNHAWNEVLVDGRWFTQDTTWDAGFLDMKENFVKRVRHKYFDPDPTEFAKTHKAIPRPQQ